MDIGQNWLPQSLDGPILKDWPVNPWSPPSRYEDYEASLRVSKLETDSSRCMLS